MNAHTPGPSHATEPSIPSKNALWYVVFGSHVLAPLWGAGGFVLALAFMVVPDVLLDRHAYARIGSQASAKGRDVKPLFQRVGLGVSKQWSRLAAQSVAWTRRSTRPREPNQ